MRHDLPTTLVYYNEESASDPYAHQGKPINGVVIEDIGDRANEFNLDDHGFTLVNQVSEVKDFFDEELVKAQYYPEIEKLLKETTGASRVVVFNHITRLSQEMDHKKAPDSQLSARPAVKWVHLDRFSYPQAARDLVFQNVPASEAEKLVQKRYQILNIWRPIKTILRDPFGIAASVPDSDLVSMPYTTPEESGVKFGVRPSPTHRWYYKYKQEPNEVLLFKAFDTDTSCRETRVPHSAFTDIDEEDKAPRESIETRALLFYD